MRKEGVTPSHEEFVFCSGYFPTTIDLPPLPPEYVRPQIFSVIKTKRKKTREKALKLSCCRNFFEFEPHF